MVPSQSVALQLAAPHTSQAATSTACPTASTARAVAIATHDAWETPNASAHTLAGATCPITAAPSEPLQWLHLTTPTSQSQSGGTARRALPAPPHTEPCPTAASTFSLAVAASHDGFRRRGLDKHHSALCNLHFLNTSTACESFYGSSRKTRPVLPMFQYNRSPESSLAI
jgi:hypothetical protein